MSTPATDPQVDHMLGDASRLLDALGDRALSLSAKGLYCTLRTFRGVPASMGELAVLCRDRPIEISRALEELEQAGLVARSEHRDALLGLNTTVLWAARKS